MFPQDFYFDNDKEDRISINILCHVDFGFFDLVDEFAKTNGLEIAKKKYQVQTSGGVKSMAEESSKKNKKKQVGKVSWMLGKMVGFIDMFKEKKEQSSSEEESEDGQHQNYRNFCDDDQSDDTYGSSSKDSKIYSENDLDPRRKLADNVTKKINTFKESTEHSQKAMKSDDSPALNEQFHEKYEQSILEIKSHRDKYFESELPGDSPENMPEMDLKFTSTQSKSVKSSNLENMRSNSPLGKQDNLSEGGSSEAKQKPIENKNLLNTPNIKGCPNKPSSKELFKKIIIHIHGGGFMAMSSTYHETYLRHFANEVERPVFSIDYRLAPIAKFPDPLHDCIRGYFWIKQFIEEVIGTTLESVILIGDSAGGNLAIALTFWLIENKMKTPDLLIGCYAALRIDMKSYTPSFFKSFEDYFLSYAGLWACCRQYLPDGFTSYNDKYVSPVFADGALLSQMPKTRLFTCMDDPLMDDQFRFAYNMKKCGGDIRMVAFRHFIHGMLSLNRNECLPVRVFQDEVVKCMKDHFSESKPTPTPDQEEAIPVQLNFAQIQKEQKN